MNISTYNSFYACIYQVECVDDDYNNVYDEYHDISSPSVASYSESSIAAAAVDQVSRPVGTGCSSVGPEKHATGFGSSERYR